MQASYPLWDLNLGKVKEAQARMNKQKIKLETLKKQVGLEVYEALLDSELADKQVLLQKQALDEADELLRQVTSSYEEGP
jgi:outer membrane protein TolC